MTIEFDPSGSQYKDDLKKLAEQPAQRGDWGPGMNKEFEALLGQYWDLAYLEGKSGISQGDKANEVLHALKRLTEPSAPAQDWKADVQKVRDALDPEDWCGDERMIDVLDRALTKGNPNDKLQT